MRLALITPGFSRDGAEFAIPALQTLACKLAEQLDVEVFSLRYPAAGTYTFCGLRHQAIGGGTQMGIGSARIWRAAARAIVARHRRQPFDLLHAFWVDEPAFVAALAGALLRRPVLASSGGGELVYFDDLDYGTQGSAWRRLLIRFALRQATLVTAGSAYQRGLCLRSGVPAAKVKLAPLGVDSDHFRPAPDPPAVPTVVQAASLVPVKQQAVLLDVITQARLTLPELQLIVAGDGPLAPDLQARARQLGLAGNVSWLGRVPHRKMPSVYHQAHLYLQTSRHESQGLAVVEALACGLPALGTPVGFLPEVAALPVTNVREQLAGQIVALLEDGESWEEQAGAARALAVAQFDLPVTTARFLALATACVTGQGA
jgi:glycosyltransferase involved in cell wall biosynthesis